ncbi:helix-turn-helix domain-containing protein [Modestobacter lapidis]|nr:helix-turn-helix domain-containing protein [Modestobacter lapidis]
MSDPRKPQALARDPKHYVHGLDGAGVVIVPARVAAWLHQNLPLDRLRSEVRGVDAEVDVVLIGLSVAGLNWRASVHGTVPRNVPEPAPKSQWLTTTQVADLLDQTDRAIRMACQSGRLPAEQENGRWRISRENFEHYRAARDQRAA